MNDSPLALGLDCAKEATKDYKGPFLILDLNVVRDNARRFLTALPNVQPHYAVKANPNPEVLSALHEEGVRFEVASPAELDLLLSLGVQAETVLYSNPVRSRSQIGHAINRGVEWFVVDNENEVRKVVELKPDAKLYLRIDTPNEGSEWPLGGKFGAHEEEIPKILATAVDVGADLAGVGFHVGSQCLNPGNWPTALGKAAVLFEAMREKGLRPRLINLGGGFPVYLTRPVPSIEEIAGTIRKGLEPFPGVEVVAEPGRYMVANAGYFVCRVMGTATRDKKQWLHIDAGVFGGLFEAFEGIKHTIETDRQGDLVPWEVAGPTCDSIDVVFRGALLPSDLQEGDYLYFRNAGAYTTAYASEFNGFPLPREILLGT